MVPDARDASKENVRELRARLVAIKEELQEREVMVTNALDRTLAGKDDADLEKRMVSLQGERDDLRAKSTEIQEAVDSEQRRIDNLERDHGKQQEAYAKWLEKRDDRDTRARLNMAPKRTVEKIVFDEHKNMVRVEFKGVARSWSLEIRKVGKSSWHDQTLRDIEENDETWEGEEMIWSSRSRSSQTL